MPRLAVLGHPVAHSRSPAMHNAALAELGLAGEWSYEAIDVSPGRVRAAGAGDGARRGSPGPTSPSPQGRGAGRRRHALGDRARDRRRQHAQLRRGRDPRRQHRCRPGCSRRCRASPRGRRALVLGAGGAARAVVWALLREGAEVEVWNRTELRSRHLCEELGGEPVRRARPGRLRPDRQLDLGRAGRRGPLRRAAAAPRGVRVRAGRRRHGLRRAEPSPLLAAAAAAGAATVDGIEVLVRQGALSLRIWTGREPPLETMCVRRA